MTVGGVSHVDRTTVSRLLNRNGYFKLQTRKKGLLSDYDKSRRLRFAREMLKRDDIKSYWMDGVTFYLDACSFVYKRNPSEQASAPGGRCWRKKSEGLRVTAKGSACGTGGKYVRLIVCIAYGKGVVWCRSYDKMTGDTFARFIKKDFNRICKKCGKSRKDICIWLQDGDKCQNSIMARTAMAKVHPNTIQKIPPRSPDLNPIENVFHNIKNYLKKEAIRKKIVCETKEEYEFRIKTAMFAYSKDKIDRTIKSMEKRLRLVVKGRGDRTKY